ncbi:MAG: EAL domain-containing protein, partial [Bacilli bacterium]
VKEEAKEEATPTEEVKEEVKEEAAPTEEVKEEAKEAAPAEEVKEEAKEEAAPTEEVKEEAKEEAAPTEEVKEEAKEEAAPTEEVKEEAKEEAAPTEEVKEEAKEEAAPAEETAKQPKEAEVEEPKKVVRPPYRQMVRPESRKETKVFTLNKQPKAQMPTLPKNKLKKEALVTEDKERIVELLNKGINEGFTYLFTPATDFDNNVVYIQLHQCVEIDENTRIMEEVYAPVAEESELIFQINKLAVEKTLEEAKKKVDIKFAVNLSTKYLSSQEKIDELVELLARCPSNIILIIDAIKVKDCDEEQVARLYDLLNKTNLRMMLDNVEDARVSLLFELPVYYLRIDGDYYVDHSPTQISLLSFYSSFTKNAKIHLSCKNINELSQVAFINKYSKRIEGDAVMTARLSVNDIQSSLRKK